MFAILATRVDPRVVSVCTPRHFRKETLVPGSRVEQKYKRTETQPPSGFAHKIVTGGVGRGHAQARAAASRRIGSASVAYKAAAINRFAWIPSHIDTITATMDAMTPEAPFTPHIQAVTRSEC